MILPIRSWALWRACCWALYIWVGLWVNPYAVSACLGWSGMTYDGGGATGGQGRRASGKGGSSIGTVDVCD